MKRLTGLMAAVGLLLMLAMPVAAGNHQGGDDKVTICHATGADNNPYVAITVPTNSGYEPHLDDNGNPLNGHEQDFLLQGSGLDACDDILDPVTPMAPVVGDATCAAAGTLTLTPVEGVIYTTSYTAGASGVFEVTATAAEGYVIAEGATTTFNVTVMAQLNCAAGVAPSVSAGTCVAPGMLTLNAVTGVVYSISPAYSAGATGTFTVTAAAAAGFTLTGESTFVVTVPAQLVCNSGTQGGTGGPAAPPVRTGTLAGTGGPAAVPNTATEQPANQLVVAIGALLLVASLGSIGTMLPAARRNRR